MGIDGLRRGEKGLPHEARLDPFGEGHRGSSKPQSLKNGSHAENETAPPGKSGARARSSANGLHSGHSGRSLSLDPGVVDRRHAMNAHRLERFRP